VFPKNGFFIRGQYVLSKMHKSRLRVAVRLQARPVLSVSRRQRAYRLACRAAFLVMR